MDALSPEQFLEALVRIPSLSGNERRASEFAVSQMKALGYADAYVDAAGSAVGVWGTKGGSPRIVLLGHIDTVPGDVPVRIENGNLYGRGSVDAKGPLATFIHAVASLPQNVAAEIVVIGATEEEAATSKGARQALVDLEPPDFCVIGEPSGTNGVTLGYKGRMIVSVDVRRPSTHTAHSHQSVAEAAIAIHTQMNAYVNVANEGMAGIFDRIDMSVRSFNTGSDGLEDTAKVTIGLRLGPSFPLDKVGLGLRESASKAVLDEAATFEMSFQGQEEAIRRDRRNPLVSSFFAAIRSQGMEPKTLVKTGTADMNVVGPHWPCPICAYGPGDSSLDHTPNEHLTLSEFRTAIEVLSFVLSRLTSQN